MLCPAAIRKRSSYKADAFQDKRSDKTDIKAQCKFCRQSPHARHRCPASNRRCLNCGKLVISPMYARHSVSSAWSHLKLPLQMIKVKVQVPSTERLIACGTCVFKRSEHSEHCLLISVYQGLEVQQPQPFAWLPDRGADVDAISQTDAACFSPQISQNFNDKRQTICAANADRL